MSVCELERLEELRALLVAEATGTEVWKPEPHQIAPDGDWDLWYLQGGRGCGKTDTMAAHFDRFLSRNRGTRGRIIAPTLGDAVEACVNGPSGLKAHNPTVTLSSKEGGYHVYWPNGSVAKLFGCYSKEDIERLRAGGNSHIDWFEEIAAWRYLAEALDHSYLGLRLGDHPYAIASTTPKPRKRLKELMASARTVVTTATLFDNPHNPQNWREGVVERYRGTRLWRQEVLGEYVDEVEGALWEFDSIAANRIAQAPEAMEHVTVGVDPSGGEEEGNDEQGIIAAGTAMCSCRGEAELHAFVLADESCKLSPAGWGKRACRAWTEYDGDKIVGEVNFGGDMVSANIEVAARDLGLLGVNVEKVNASRGKVRRAAPIVALYEQGKVHHVGTFEELENQMTQWDPDSDRWSPDRLDALVWALTDLMLGKQPAAWGIL